MYRYEQIRDILDDANGDRRCSKPLLGFLVNVRKPVCQINYTSRGTEDLMLKCRTGDVEKSFTTC